MGRPIKTEDQKILNCNSNAIDRRSFLKTAAPFALGLWTIARGQIPLERGRFSEPDVPRAREQLLKLVNEERLSAGLSQLELDGLANDASLHSMRTQISVAGKPDG